MRVSGTGTDWGGQAMIEAIIGSAEALVSCMGVVPRGGLEGPLVDGTDHQGREQLQGVEQPGGPRGSLHAWR